MASHSLRLLGIDTLVTGYGRNQVLNGVSLSVSVGEIVAIIGHNGAGKSTLLKAVSGLVPIWSGSVSYDGTQLDRIKPRDLLRGGVAYVPQGNPVFAELTVRENLEVAGLILSSRARLREEVERALLTFPQLRSCLRQRAVTLSGGERQMLALVMGMMTSPRLLLLDEPLLGLAPALASETLRRIRELACHSSVAVLIVEQKVREVLKIAERVYVLRSGEVSFAGRAESLQDEGRLRNVYI